MNLIQYLIVFLSLLFTSNCLIKVFRFDNFNRRKNKIKKIQADKFDSAGKTGSREENPLYVPPKILEKLRNVKSTNDFLVVFNLKDRLPNRGQTELDGELTSDPIESSPVVQMEGYECMPRKTLVEIPLTDASATQWPPCVFVNRCGGCCFNTRLMKCQPSHTYNRTITVYKIPHQTGVPIQNDIQIPEDKSCQCQCRVQPSDCNPQQTFVPSNCQCECKRKASSCASNKQWSQRSCQCECSVQQTCEKKFLWNPSTCRCECKKKKCRKYFKLNKTTCRCIFNFSGLLN